MLRTVIFFLLQRLSRPVVRRAFVDRTAARNALSSPPCACLGRSKRTFRESVECTRSRRQASMCPSPAAGAIQSRLVPPPAVLFRIADRLGRRTGPGSSRLAIMPP